ncbi:MAG: hypothetical protein ABGY22_06515 [Acidimicrobiales bacterium]|jgi:hypothetical protein|nr:hypothetical protein [Acidimicrobiia bacterium]HIL48578.1 hypothetical protein [Acidimicrobiia bacterium]
METRLPFPTRKPSQTPGRGSGRLSTRRLDARTREIGLAGVASARLVLAACRSGTDSLPDSTDRDPTGADDPVNASKPTGNDDPAVAVPVGGADRALPEAA